jgi:hypothetical protein
MDYVILLTGCINPNGMSFTKLSDVNIRMKQYIEAIDFYLGNTVYPIIFAENSGTDLSEHYAKDIRNKHLEILSFEGNSNKDKGKGYGEAGIIDYVLKNSQTIKSVKGDCCIIKITGRLIVTNINKIIKARLLFQPNRSILASFNSNFSFVDSRIFIAPIDFYKSFLLNKEEINDSKNYYFENVLADSIIKESRYHYYPFFVEPQIIGQSGTTGNYYTPQKITINNRFRYLVHIYKTIIIFYKRISVNKIDSYILAIYKLAFNFLRIMEKAIFLIS